MPDQIECREVLLEKWDFDWPVLGVLIGGRSSIDLPNLFVENFEDANRFIINYGYDPADPNDAKHIHCVIVEALNFIEKNLIPKEWKKGLQPPKEVLLCSDVRDLLMWASEEIEREDQRRDWACAVLRVMHTIAHIGDLDNSAAMNSARDQIFSEFEKLLFRKLDGSLWFGDKRKSVAIERVEWKYAKTRESIILKLLHKAGNVAETIFDRLGIRIITKEPLDSLVMVQFLREFYLVTFPNTTPARSKNTLIDIEKFQPQLEVLWTQLNKEKISCEEFLSQLDKDYSTSTKGHMNPHSSQAYRSIQLTCRQLIHYDDPRLLWKRKLLEHMKKNKETMDPKMHRLAEEIMTFSDVWSDSDAISEMSIFFPFEVQILSADMSRMIEAGAASHDRYKMSQVRAARKRTLAPLLK